MGKWLAMMDPVAAEEPALPKVSKVSKSPLDIPGYSQEVEYQEAIREHLAERAAIMEFDGGLTKEQAEAEAQRALRVYEYRLAEGPDTWLVMITPGCDLGQATRACHNTFGTDRVLEVREYKHAIRKIS